MRATWLSGYMAALHLNFGLDSFTPAQGVLALRASSLHRWWKTSFPHKHPAACPLQRGGSAASGHLSPFFTSWLQGEGSTSGRGHAGWVFLFWPVLPASPLPPALQEGVSYSGPNLEWRGRGEAKQEGGKDRGEVHGGERVPWGKAARLGGCVAGRAKSGKLQSSKEVKEILETEELEWEIELKKKGGQNWLLGVLRDNKNNENNEKVRKIKLCRYKCLGCSEPTHKVPMASPRDSDQPPQYPRDHNLYPPLRGQVSSGGVNVIFPYSCLLFHASWGGCLFCSWV